MNDLTIGGEHTLRAVVQKALGEGLDKRETMPELLARATMAILNVDPNLNIHDAYHLANQFGCDENIGLLPE